MASGLRKALAKRTKAELVDMLAELAKEDRQVFRRLAAHIELKSPPQELAAATRQAILDATAFDEQTSIATSATTTKLTKRFSAT